MTRFTTCIFLLISVMYLAVLPGTAKADCAGGEVIYKWLSDSTYRVFFKYYDDCSGSTVPATQNLCGTNPCDPSKNISVAMQLWTGTLSNGQANGSPVSVSCPGYPTKCQSPSSVLPDYREWWYSTDVTLHVSCNAWRFAVFLSPRAISNNLSNSGFYIEATFNNKDFQGNSSPDFTVRPVVNICRNQAYTYNSGAVDPNKDSLAIEVMRPQTAVSCSGVPGNIAFNTGSPPYAIPGNPIQTGNTFSIDGALGKMTYTPGLAGPATITTRVKEYRNGILVGQVMRDVQVQVTTGCSNTPPAISIANVTGGQAAGIYLYTCQEAPFNFCFDIKSSDPSAVLSLSDNHTTALPSSGMVYSNQNTDSVRGCLSWSPIGSDSGIRTLVINVRDGACNTPGLQYYYTYTIPVYVWGKTRALKYTALCTGDSASLLAINGLNFVWTALPGGSGTASLSCTNCPNPFAKPALTTTYQVTSANTYCPTITDTVTVKVNDNPFFTPMVDLVVCPRVPVQLNINTAPPPGASYTYKWTPSSFLSSDIIPNPVSNTNNDITYNLVITTHENCKGYDTVSIDVLDGFMIFNSDSMLCLGQTMKINATGDSRYTYQWTATTLSNNITSPTQVGPLIEPKITGTQTYILTAKYTGCADTADSLRITVEPYPVIDVAANIRLCIGDSIYIDSKISPADFPFTYKWIPPANISNPNISNPYFYGNVLGPFTSYLIASSAAGCADTAIVGFYVSSPTEFLTLLSNDTTICPPDSVQLHVVGNGLNKVNWHPGISMTDTASFDPYAFPGASTRYYVIGVDTNGCSDSLGVTINVKPAGEVYLPDTVYVYPGESIRLDPQGNCLYFSWNNYLYMDRGGVANPLITPLSSNRYIAFGSTEYGCKGSDTIDIILLENSVMDVPNAFTPGNRKLNTMINGVYRGRVSLKYFRIYNRWGNKVFETDDINTGWDGTFNGELQPMGVYIYAIDALVDKKRIFQKQGNITLIR